jgi:hypothetical protein
MTEIRSRLAADYAGYLDRHGTTWEYEPERFTGDGLQWCPDFHETKDNRDALVEIQPDSLLDRKYGVHNEAQIDEILTRMSVAWLSRPDAWLELVFWSCGASKATMRICAERGMPWIIYGLYPGLHPLWPGMGQFRALDHRWGAVQG